jgi:outer membrane protein assembly factor BamB
MKQDCIRPKPRRADRLTKIGAGVYRPFMPASRSRFLALSLLTVSLISFPRPLIAQQFNWPNLRGPAHNGVSGEGDWNWNWKVAAPKVKWRVDLGLGYSAVAVVDGRVFTMGNTKAVDYIYALEEKSGRVLWNYSYPCTSDDISNRRGPRATPTVAGLRVFTLSHMGHLLCLDYNSGRLIWSRTLMKDLGGNRPLWGYSASPLVVGSLVIVETGNRKNASVVALNAENGRTVWASGTDDAGYSTPVPFQMGDLGGVAVLSGESISGRLVNNGRILFRSQWRTRDGINVASPLIWEDKVFVTSGYNSGAALNRFGNNYFQALWSNRYFRSEMSSPVLIDGHVYGFDDSELRCVDIVNGVVKWRSNLYGKGALMAAGKRLVVQAENGPLAVVEATPWQFKELARLPIASAKECWTQPVLSNGTIYARVGGSLVAVDVSTK